MCSDLILQRNLSMTPLRRRMTEDMQIRNFAAGTQQAYINSVARFILVQISCLGTFRTLKTLGITQL